MYVCQTQNSLYWFWDCVECRLLILHCIPKFEEEKKKTLSPLFLKRCGLESLSWKLFFLNCKSKLIACNLINFFSFLHYVNCKVFYLMFWIGWFFRSFLVQDFFLQLRIYLKELFTYFYGYFWEEEENTKKTYINHHGFYWKFICLKTI